jgi:plasmid stabilization system protein ParE
MKASWTTRAELELQQIMNYIAEDDPVAAYDWCERLVRRADAVAQMKMSGRVVPELRREDIREVFVGSYRIIYRVLPGGIEVTTVLEGHMPLARDLDPGAP